MMPPCPRCLTGRLSADSDHYGHTLDCLNCGHVVYLDRRGRPVEPLSYVVRSGPLPLADRRRGKRKGAPL